VRVPNITFSPPPNYFTLKNIQLVTNNQYFILGMDLQFQPPDSIPCGSSVCPIGNTCCNWSNGPGCCTFKNANCCQTGCCPFIWDCDGDNCATLLKNSTLRAKKNLKSI